jgi:hypothetical protein
MASRRSVSKSLAILVCTAAIATSLVAVRGQTPGQAAVRVDSDDIGGVVMGARAPEAGVWVIAETTELNTPLRKIVVTDDQGRFLVPDLPKANYDVWVRGYGLVDSAKVKSAPGKQVNLTAVPAPNAKAAAEYYPAQYWLSLLKVPPKSDFPGTGPTGNGISTNIKTQGEWIRNVVNTDGCTGCHQMGNKATREIPKALGTFSNSAAAWERRVQSGQAGAGMLARFTQAGKERATAMWGDWTDRIAAGALPATAPPRPQGRERNAVGLGRPEGLPPRRDRVRQAQPDGERQRTSLRRDGRSRRLHAGRAAEDQCDRTGAAAGARSEDAAARTAHPVVALLGR